MLNISTPLFSGRFISTVPDRQGSKPEYEAGFAAVASNYNARVYETGDFFLTSAMPESADRELRQLALAHGQVLFHEPDSEMEDDVLIRNFQGFSRGMSH